jgi:hypothetical protein
MKALSFRIRAFWSFRIGAIPSLLNRHQPIIHSRAMLMPRRRPSTSHPRNR